MSGEHYVLRTGDENSCEQESQMLRVSNANYAHQCKKCDFYRSEIFSLQKQMAAMEKEHNLKLSLERERFRKLFKEKQMVVVKQLNKLANGVSFELDDNDYGCTQNNRINGISTNNIEEEEVQNLLVADMAPAVGAKDPLKMDDVRGDVLNSECSSMITTDEFQLNDEILANGIKFEFSEEDSLQDDPFGELNEGDSSFDEDTPNSTDLKTSNRLTSDEFIDSDIQIDDIKCEPGKPHSLESENALINLQSRLLHVRRRNVSASARMPNLTGPLCYEKCRQKCSGKLSMAQREAIFSAYHSLDATGKNFVISSCFHRKNVQFHRKNTRKQKLHSFHYFITVPEQPEPIRLCKTAMCTLFHVSPKRIEHIQHKYLAGELTDRRGKHTNHKDKKPEHVLNEMCLHFDSFKMENPAANGNVAQNGNAKKKKKSSSKATVKQMYENYIESCKSKGLSNEYFVNYAFYVTYFHKRRTQSHSC